MRRWLQKRENKKKEGKNEKNSNVFSFVLLFYWYR